MSALDDEISRLMQRCISCGKCTPVCPSARHGGCDPHEVMVIGEGDLTQCLQCGNCSRACRRSDPFTAIRDLIFLQGGFENETVDTRRSMTEADHPSRTELPPVWDGGDVAVLPGCVVKCLAPFLEYAASVAIRSTGSTCTELEGEGCCLRGARYRGMTDHQRHEVRDSMLADAHGRVVSLCPECRDELVKDGFQVMDLLDFLHENLSRLPRMENPFPVALEPGCNARERIGLMEDVVRAIGCEPIGNRSGCCGRGGDLSGPLMAERQAECAGSSAIVVACPRCFESYDSLDGGRPVLFIGELVALAHGDGSSLVYHRIPVPLDDPQFYVPKEDAVNIHEDRTRW